MADDPRRNQLGARWNSEGWQAWNGGERPVSSETIVIVQTRGGFERGPVKAGLFAWIKTDDNPEEHIVAYRVVEERP